MLEGKPISQEIAERKRLVESPSLTEVVRVASRVFGVKREEILDKGSRRDKARKVAISICQQYTGLSNGAIGDTLSGEYGRTWVTPFSPLGL